MIKVYKYYWDKLESISNNYKDPIVKSKILKKFNIVLSNEEIKSIILNHKLYYKEVTE